MVRLARLELLAEEGRDEDPAGGLSTIGAVAERPDSKPQVSISGDRTNIIQKMAFFVDYKVKKVFVMAWFKCQSLSSECVVCLPSSIVNCSSVFIFIR